jgi:DNA-binding CsgD family transcriptional regulator
MFADHAFSELIGRIYDCAIDKSRWAAVLEDICGILKGKFADLIVYDGYTTTAEVGASYGWTPEHLERMARHLHLNPVAPMILVQPLGEPWCGTRDMGFDRLRETLYWKSCLSDFGTMDLLAVAFARKVTQVGVWEVTGALERGPFSDSDIEFARVITPHIRRAVEFSGLLRYQAVAEGALRDILERLAAAAVIIAPDGTIRYSNKMAEVEFRKGSFARDLKGKLVGTHSEVAHLLASLSETLGRPQLGRDVVVADSKGRRLHITGIRLDRAENEADAPFLVLLRPPEPDLKTPLSAAVELYSLTAAETQTLAQVLEGRSLDEASAVLGVARSTVKTHLDAVFAKSGTHRQPDLVRRVMGLVTTLR